ncbi:MAG: type II toxin-antitoxin system VapC family toxin [Methanomassiliicoccaceae archaeon]|nr:type II toxin-antitoxin system VapC family toxin [Methanomassiliicoccaceae archaeon]
MANDEKGERKNAGRPKVYMETTTFNYFFDDDRGQDHKYTVKLFEQIKDGKFEAFTSAYVIDELKKAREEKRDKMLELVNKYGIGLIGRNDEVERLGRLYVAKGVIPKGFLTDALHIAIATVHGLDIIVSMNFEHIVKLKTIRMTGIINIENGYDPIEIRSSGEVVKDDIKD